MRYQGCHVSGILLCPPLSSTLAFSACLLISLVLRACYWVFQRYPPHRLSVEWIIAVAPSILGLCDGDAEVSLLHRSVSCLSSYWSPSTCPAGWRPWPMPSWVWLILICCFFFLLYAACALLLPPWHNHWLLTPLPTPVLQIKILPLAAWTLEAPSPPLFEALRQCQPYRHPEILACALATCTAKSFLAPLQVAVGILGGSQVVRHGGQPWL
jgi:hypothetical protein